MRVLWLTNIMLPVCARALGLAWSEREGWLTGCHGRMEAEAQLSRREGHAPEFELSVAFPAVDERSCYRAGAEPLRVGETVFYGFMEELTRPEEYDATIESSLREILKVAKPDVIHIFGTEFPHTLAMLRICELEGVPRSRVLISMQGVCSQIARDYMGGLPKRVQTSRTLRDILRRDSLMQQQAKMIRRGERESEALGLAVHVAGRTAFDRESVLRVNGSLHYHELQETMRPVFYEAPGDGAMSSGAGTHTLFLAQGDVPFKGVHWAIAALSRLVARYPDARMRVAGNDVSGVSALRIGGYGRYLRQLIGESGLGERITFLGYIDAQRMREELLHCETFLCPSSIENSPNSLAEAMLSGVPCVASRTGGIPSMADDGTEVSFFKKNDPEDLADKVSALWEDTGAAARMGQQARARALVQHDPENNYRTLTAIYREIGR